MAEITNAGFAAKSQNEYFEEIKQFYLDIDANWNLDPSTPDALKIASDAERFAALDEVLLKAYVSKHPDFASGRELDYICALSKVVRKAGTSSEVELVFSGAENAVIPSDTKIEDNSGAVWLTKSEAIIDDTLQASVTAYREQIGAVQADANTITTLAEAIAGVDSVTNPLPARAGSNIESDADLRIRREQSVAASSMNQIDTMTSALLALDNVKHVRIYENFTSAVDIKGLPPKSVAIIVDGGDADDIAKAIFKTRSVGVLMHAAATEIFVENVFDKYETNAVDITFSRPNYVPIELDITIVDDGSLPPQVVDEIKAAILSYASGDLFDEGSCQGFARQGFAIADDVAASRLFTPINRVLGFYGGSYVQSLEINGDAANLSIDFKSIASFAQELINITLVTV